MALGLLKRFQLWSRPGVARLWWLPSLRLAGDVPRSHTRWQADRGRHQRGHTPWRSLPLETRLHHHFSHGQLEEVPACTSAALQRAVNPTWVLRSSGHGKPQLTKVL